jgi:histidyl-tRNA synthetase
LAEQLRDQLEQAIVHCVSKLVHRQHEKPDEKADQSGAVYAMILGEREWNAGELTIKELATAEQSTVAIEQLVSFLTEKLAK